MIVLDTHVLVWWLADPQKLTTSARRVIKAASGSQEVAVSAISLFEIATLLRRGRLQMSVDSGEWFAALQSLPELTIEPISAEIAWRAGEFDATLPGDPADRIIVATARELEAPLVTADDRLRADVAIETVW